MARLKMTVGHIMTSISTVLLILATVVAVISGVAFDRGFYKNEYQKLSTAEYVGVSEKTLYEATENLLSYLEDDRIDLSMVVSVQGKPQEFYTQREKDHMIDVKHLYRDALLIMKVFFVIGASMFAIVLYLLQADKKMWKNVIISIIAVLVFFALLGAWAAVDFSTFWVKFHHLFFSNDLWQLNPANSRMIRMFQQEFFFHMVAKILILFMVIVVSALLVSIYLYRRRKKNEI